MKRNDQFLLTLMFVLPLLTACASEAELEPPAGSYSVSLTPPDFVSVVDNQYYPLIPGSKWVYEAKLENGTVEHNEVEVLAEARTVNNVTATVVHDIVLVGGQIAEETYDWYAQDKDGNVWYLGEEVNNYNNGALVNHAGSWEWGKDGALPGVIMWADPEAHMNETYYQEYYAGEAEDQGKVLSVDEKVTVPFGSFESVVMTFDSSALDPDLKENKFYARGIGLIKEIDRNSGEEVVLIEFTAGKTIQVDIPLAPESERVDLIEPTFSNPTKVSNPLFPYSQTDQIILLGKVDGQPFHVIYTRLPGTRKIDWNEEQVDTIIVQYVAHLNGRIQEYALDWYAQADDSSVWYFGEDVFDYEDGVVVSTEGTWLVGRDGPLAMIMPRNPKVGDVFRVENIPGVAFEEVTVTATDVTVQGPVDPIEGAMVARELHMDGSYSNKTFAPGYGEFVTINQGELEALALAVPLDALPGPTPTELHTLSRGAQEIFNSAQSEDWNSAAETLAVMITAWDSYKAQTVPIMLEAQMSEAMNVLIGAMNTREPAEAQQAALNVALASLDLQLQFRLPAEIDLGRFKTLTHQILLDVAADDPGGVISDVVTLELTRDRFVHTLDKNNAASLNALLNDLRVSAEEEDLESAANLSSRLLDLITTLEPVS